MGKGEWKDERAFDREAQAAGRKELPEVMEMDLADGGSYISLLMEEGASLKRELDAKIPDSKAARLNEIKEELAMIQASNDLKGLRHNNIVFVARLQDGRVTVDAKKRDQFLLMKGVKAELLEEASEHARKQGEPFWVKELAELEG